MGLFLPRGNDLPLSATGLEIEISRAEKAHKHKETYRTPPNSDPTLRFFMWGPLLLENKAEGATHIKNLGLHCGPLHSLCGYSFMPGGGVVSRPVASGQKFMCCVRNPTNINVFVRVPGQEESGSRPGGSVTGVTEKLFMCQMFMCLFRPLYSDTVREIVFFDLCGFRERHPWESPCRKRSPAKGFWQKNVTKKKVTKPGGAPSNPFKRGRPKNLLRLFVASKIIFVF